MKLLSQELELNVMLRRSRNNEQVEAYNVSIVSIGVSRLLNAH